MSLLTVVSSLTQPAFTPRVKTIDYYNDHNDISFSFKVSASLSSINNQCIILTRILPLINKVSGTRMPDWLGRGLTFDGRLSLGGFYFSGGWGDMDIRNKIGSVHDCCYGNCQELSRQALLC